MLKENEEKIKEFAKELEPIYKLFNWKWYNIQATPTADEIEETIRHLVREVENIGDKHSTGGLSVEMDEVGSYVISWELTKNIYLHI